MQRHEMIDAMRALGLKGMAGAFDEAVTTGIQRQRTTPEILTDLLRAEAAHRHAASIRYRMSAAKLPVMKNPPPGVHRASQGDAEAMAELFGGIIGAMGAGVALIYAVLVLLFGSFFKPATILSALPLSLMGCFLAILITGKQIDLPVLIGALMLLGLAAKNSILLVEFAIEAERSGMSRREALYEACRERARPIIMTTVAMAAGMLPTALGLGEGSGFRQPMAVAVIGGLITSTALSLVLVPVVYEFIDQFELWITPKLGKLATPKAPGDDRPIDPSEQGHQPATAAE